MEWFVSPQETLLRSLESSVEKREEELKREALVKGDQLQVKEDLLKELYKEMEVVKEVGVYLQILIWKTAIA